MLRVDLRRPNLVLAALLIAAAGACVPPAHEAVRSPKPGPSRVEEVLDQATCKIARDAKRPYVVDWNNDDLGSLAADMSKGVVAVAYSGCYLKPLPGCRLKGSYDLTTFTRGKSVEKITTRDALYASLPLGAAGLEGRIEAGQALAIAYATVGKRSAVLPNSGSIEIDAGNCEGANHYVSGLMVGAFELSAGERRDIEAGANFFGAGAGGKTATELTSVKNMGNVTACAASAPVAECQAPIRLELVPIPGIDAESGQGIQGAGFGKGLGQIQAVQVATFTLPPPPQPKVSGRPDLRVAKMFDEVYGLDQAGEAAPETLIEKYRPIADFDGGNNPYREIAQTRIAALEAFIESQRKACEAGGERIAELRRVLSQRESDRKELTEYMALADYTIPKVQKQAYQKEFDQAYAPWEVPLAGLEAAVKEHGAKCGDWGEMVTIPGGSFMMGCSPGDDQCSGDEKPAVKVTLKGFRLMAKEVTQGQYQAKMGNNPSRFQECGLGCPVEVVTWHDAKSYCEKIGGRLPAEAEWEYAARAGSTQARYGDLDAIAWYDGNSGGQTHPVGEKKPNAWGLYDMLGNVWEWTESGWSEHPGGTEQTSGRVGRGGGWFYDAGNVRAADRDGGAPGDRTRYLGFRCAGTKNY